MRRAAVGAALVAAVLAGSVTGIGLHGWRPDPLGLARHGTQASAGPTSTTRTADPATTAPSGGGSGGSGGTGGTPSASGSESSGNPSPSATPDPDFDRRALMRTTDFTANGWETSRVIASYPQLPDPPITPCVSISGSDSGLVDGFAGGWSSSHTEAEEVIARYVDAAAARRDYSRLLVGLGRCDRSELQITSFARTEESSGLAAIRWFNTRGPDDDTRGVIGLVRRTDRIALLYISSADSDPDDTHAHGTTDIRSLLVIAGRRLG